MNLLKGLSEPVRIEQLGHEYMPLYVSAGICSTIDSVL